MSDKIWPDYPTQSYDAEVEAELEELERLWPENLSEDDVFAQALKESDDVALPESGVYFDALEARILGALDAAIESGEIENREVPERNVTEIPVSAATMVAQKSKARRRALSARAGQLAILTGVTMLMAGKWPANPASGVTEGRKSAKARTVAASKVSSARQELQAAHQAAPKVLTGTVISFESDADLALEIAARRMVAYHQEE